MRKVLLLTLSAAALLCLWLVLDPSVRSALPDALSTRLDALGSGAAAAWVQAVFSVIAIYIAGRTVVLEHRNSALRDMESLEGCVGAIREEVEEVGRLLLSTGSRHGPLREYNTETLKNLESMIAAFPVQALGSSKAPALVLRLRSILTELATDVPQYAYNGGYDAPNSHEVDLAQRSVDGARADHELVLEWTRGRRRHRDRWWLPGSISAN